MTIPEELQKRAERLVMEYIYHPSPPNGRAAEYKRLVYLKGFNAAVRAMLDMGYTKPTTMVPAPKDEVEG